MKYIAILGMGVVGGSVYEVLRQNGSFIGGKCGDGIKIKYVLDRRTFVGHELENSIVNNIETIVNDKDITCVVETMGGIHPAYEFSLACIESGKSVVTSNKAVVEAFGRELEEKAEQHGVHYLYEASVGGGIPVIHPLKTCFLGEKITEIKGILNGTTNYILEQMEQNGLLFEDALKQAQSKGYAEADAANDIEGLDTARKLCILSSVCFGKNFRLADCERIVSISGITKADIDSALNDNRRIKLIGRATLTESGVRLSVSPEAFDSSSLLYAVNGVNNCIVVTGESVGDVAFFGHGAGGKTTAAAIIEDIIRTF